MKLQMYTTCPIQTFRLELPPIILLDEVGSNKVQAFHGKQRIAFARSVI